MNVCSIDIRDMLEATSTLGLVFADDLYIGKEPDKPANCVTIFDTPGFPVDSALDKSRYYHSSIQIRVRNKVYENGMSLAQDIVDSLLDRAQEIWNGTLYTFIECSSGPALLDYDENNNARIIVNFNLQRR